MTSPEDMQLNYCKHTDYHGFEIMIWLILNSDLGFGPIWNLNLGFQDPPYTPFIILVILMFTF